MLEEATTLLNDESPLALRMALLEARAWVAASPHAAESSSMLWEQCASLNATLGETRDAPFRDLVAECEDRIQVVVSFLAVLELYREGRVDLSQGETFGEIHVRWQG